PLAYVSSQPLKTAKVTFLSSSGSRESRSSESDPGSHAVQSLSPAAEAESSPELPPLLLTPQAERVSTEAAARLPSLRIVERTVSFPFGDSFRYREFPIPVHMCSQSVAKSKYGERQSFVRGRPSSLVALYPSFVSGSR